MTLSVEEATLRHLLADCWQTTLRAGAGDAKCLVELRGFEPLTPCMPSRIPATAPTTNPRVAGHCNRADGRRRGGSCGLVWLSCCAPAARNDLERRTEANCRHDIQEPNGWSEANRLVIYRPRHAGLAGAGVGQHPESVMADTAGHSLGRPASSGWAPQQRPACQGGTDMATKERQALDDRGLIRHQMRLGAGLIAFGASRSPCSR